MFVRENIKRRMQNFIPFFISLIILKPREQYLYFNVSIEIACNPLFINFCNPRKEGEKHKSFETVWNIRWRFESSGKRRNAEQAHNSRRKINQQEFRLVKHFVINAEASFRQKVKPIKKSYHEKYPPTIENRETFSSPR